MTLTNRIRRRRLKAALLALACALPLAATAAPAARPLHTTAADVSAPTAPVLSATAGNGSVTLNWTAATDDVGVTRYEVWKNTPNTWLAGLGSSARSYTVTGLTNGTSYSFRVVAYDSAGKYTNSNVVSATPVAPVSTEDTTAPSVTWTTPAEDATVSGYMFEAGNSGPSGPCEVSASDNVGVTKVLFYLDGALDTAPLNQEGYAPWNCKFDTTTVPDGPHTLKAIAFDAAGNKTTVLRQVQVSNAVEPTPHPFNTLVFQDDFNGSAINQNDWYLYNSPGNGGYGLRRPSAWSTENGLAVATATWDGTNVTSGGMSNRNHDYTYGSWEFRVRTEPDPSGVTSGVVITWPKSGNWPVDGENDIYETGTDVDRSPFYTFIHYDAQNLQKYFVHNANGQDWHIMRMDWTADAIKIYRDGALVWTLTDAYAIPDVAHHLTIQLDAFANRALNGPVKMYVDWVKVYQ